MSFVFHLVDSIFNDSRTLIFFDRLDTITQVIVLDSKGINQNFICIDSIYHLLCLRKAHTD